MLTCFMRRKRARKFIPEMFMCAEPLADTTILLAGKACRVDGQMFLGHIRTHTHTHTHTQLTCMDLSSPFPVSCLDLKSCAVCLVE